MEHRYRIGEIVELKNSIRAAANSGK